MSELFLLRHREIPGLNHLSTYLESGGFSAWKKAVTTLTPEDMVNEVKTSGLRGRGGAGFPTGLKWSFLPNTIWPHYVVANADESEPGTFKDREILEFNPYQFLEGLMLASYAVRARTAYIYLRGEFAQIARRLDERIAELTSNGYLGDHIFGKDYSLRLYTHLGAGAYICGEETALLESLEGKRGEPRLRPPFPAVAGLFGYPTVINNVETLANLPIIIGQGAAHFRSQGTEKSPGTKIFSLSGRVKKPGNYELPLGTTFRELIYQHGEGILNDGQIKAIMPAGASSALIPATEIALDTPMDYESVSALGCQLGSASVIILDETVNASALIHDTIHFFKHESCGKCTPCREGTFWMARVIDRIEGRKARDKDVDLLYSIARQMQNKCLCALGEFSTVSVISAIDNYRADFTARLEK
ncbi:MAG: NADH-quinone oxidoreductase subunit NuoF [Anaerolineaceae bacterium]|nr:NADH-quinone oxidoreductase subunit NuoF [Anaerolineaceae bacterium]